MRDDQQQTHRDQDSRSAEPAANSVGVLAGVNKTGTVRFVYYATTDQEALAHTDSWFLCCF